MKLTKTLLKEIITDVIQKKKLLEAHQAKVVQIQTAVNLVKDQWKSPDDVWWIKIDSRLKDHKHYNTRHKYAQGNPKFKNWERVNSMDGTKRENHVGYVLVRGNTVEDAVNSILNAVVHLNPWAAKEIGTKSIYSNGHGEAIIQACNYFFARAYMTICHRSLNGALQRAKADKKGNHNPFQGREFHHRIGQSKSGVDASGKDWDNERTWGLIDCDIDDPKAQQEVEQLLAKHGITPFATYLSHDGKHYLLKNCNKKASKIDFSPICNKYPTLNRPGDPPILFKPDANMMMYSRTGV